MTIITPIQKKIWKDSPTSEAISFKKANTRRIITIKPPQPNLPFFIPFTTFLFSYAINNSSIKSFHHQILRFFKFCDLIFFDSYSVYRWGIKIPARLIILFLCQKAQNQLSLSFIVNFAKKLH